jgi:nuclear pore complex protein Nup188
VLSEPASVGTLLELCNCAVDLLRRLSAQPSTGQALVPAGPTGEKPLDVGDSITAARHTLETAALYAVTQLALWTAKPDLDEHMHGDVDADDGEALDKSTSDRLGLSAWKPGSSPEARKSSMSTSDRLRRGMTGEIATDFMSMLKKARPLLLKLDDGKKNVDLVGVLAEFLQQHVSSSE